MTTTLPPSLIEVHQRGPLVAVAPAGLPATGGRAPWMAGDPQPVPAGADSLGRMLADLLTAGARPVAPRSSASANGAWCTAFGVRSLLELVDGLRTVVIVAGPGGASMETIGADGAPAAETALDPDVAADPATLGAAVLAALASAPVQQPYGSG